MDPGTVVAEDDSLKQRKNVKKAEEKTEASSPKSDPIKWFGVLVPTSLKQSQVKLEKICFKPRPHSIFPFCQGNFNSATEVVVECANIQSEILGVENRIKYIRRMKVKQEKKIMEGLAENVKNDLKLEE